ncbi:MAG TPA: 5-oxoprolinase subunit PxpB [Candidatus Limnocylindrales bacterium]|nr:5-oxoprolinase subunit PxpB [Candidatus Limnocylindrales bacterium]
MTVIEPFGDAAVLVHPRIDVHAAAAAIDALRATRPGIGRAVPAHDTVLVPFDPLAIEPDAVAAGIRAAVAGPPGTLAPAAEPGADPPIEIAVRYGGPDGPDLAAVADLHGLRPRDVIELHAGASYRVLFLGFAPGFAYLGGLPGSLATPRRPSPRERVPAGSVGIAGEQTAVYPLAMPGGWQLIGRTDARLFDPTREPPIDLRPGSRIRFVPVR